MTIIAVSAALLLVIGVIWMTAIVYSPGPHGSGTVQNALFLMGLVPIGLSMLLTLANGLIAILG